MVPGADMTKEAALAKLDVIDDALLRAWEAQIAAVPGVSAVSVLARPFIGGRPPLPRHAASI